MPRPPRGAAQRAPRGPRGRKEARRHEPQPPATRARARGRIRAVASPAGRRPRRQVRRGQLRAPARGSGSTSRSPSSSPTVTSFRSPTARSPYVIALHVLEHATEPVRFAAELSRWPRRLRTGSEQRLRADLRVAVSPLADRARGRHARLSPRGEGRAPTATSFTGPTPKARCSGTGGRPTARSSTTPSSGANPCPFASRDERRRRDRGARSRADDLIARGSGPRRPASTARGGRAFLAEVSALSRPADPGGRARSLRFVRPLRTRSSARYPSCSRAARARSSAGAETRQD